MVLGLSKSFIIFIALAIALGWYTNNYWNGVVLIVLYAVVKIIWRIVEVVFFFLVDFSYILQIKFRSG